jgi:hypothetical protein
LDISEFHSFDEHYCVLLLSVGHKGMNPEACRQVLLLQHCPVKLHLQNHAEGLGFPGSSEALKHAEGVQTSTCARRGAETPTRSSGQDTAQRAAM